MNEAKHSKPEQVFSKGRMLGLVAKFEDGRWRTSSHRDTESFESREKAIEYLLRRSNEYWASVESQGG